MIKKNFLKVHHFKTQYFPIAVDLGTGSGHYDHTTGILDGPDVTSMSDMGFAIWFTPSDSTLIAALAGHYGAFRLNKWVVKFIPYANVQPIAADTSTGATTVGRTPMLQTVLDFQDKIPLGSQTQAMEYDNYKESRFNRPHKRVFLPKLQAALTQPASGVTNTPYIQSPSRPWVSLTNNSSGVAGNIEYYGVKGFVQNYGADNIQQAWRITCIAYFSLKQLL